ncbi:hypothetical protein [Devosia nitrariae]|uniref:Transmembrane protein PGPGW n=1 Tax=Devosia nitrariae TaxID=2071872 RepID=A0ABQ5W4Q8_9HYPH|nr:hypothetical protein [Devosia nitrariae]GLQ54930.1 hypothetical protein GCM10010862_21890 [Devosia nitrariae]
MLNYLLTPVLVVLFLMGLLLTPTPLPLGVPLMAVSLFLLIATNKLIRRFVWFLRQRYSWLDNAIGFIEERADNRIRRTLRRTRPRKRKSFSRSD